MLFVKFVHHNVWNWNLTHEQAKATITACQSGQWQRSRGLFEDMIQLQVVPNLITMNAMISFSLSHAAAEKLCRVLFDVCFVFNFFELLLNYNYVSKKIRIKFGWVHWLGQVHVVIGRKLWHFLKWLNDKGTNPLWWPLVLLLRPAKRLRNGSMHWSFLKSWATLNLLQVWIWLDSLQKSPPCNESCSNLFPAGQPMHPRPCKYSTEYNHRCCNHQCLWKGWAMAKVVESFHYFASHLGRKKCSCFIGFRFF